MSYFIRSISIASLLSLIVMTCPCKWSYAGLLFIESTIAVCFVSSLSLSRVYDGHVISVHIDRNHFASATALDIVNNSAPRVEAICRSCLKLRHLHGEIFDHLFSLSPFSTAQTIYPPWLLCATAFAKNASDQTPISKFWIGIGRILISVLEWSWIWETTLLTSIKSPTTTFDTFCWRNEHEAARSGRLPESNQLISPSTARICPLSFSVMGLSFSRFLSFDTGIHAMALAYSFCWIYKVPSSYWTNYLPKNSPCLFFTCLKEYFDCSFPKISS